MAIRYRTRGFILKREAQGEADQIFTLYTEDFGKIKVLGKAIRKIKSKLRAGIGLFYLSEIEFIQGKIYKTLTDIIVIDKFNNVKNNLEKLGIVIQIAEISDDLIKGEEKDERIWNLLNEALTKLNDLKFKISDSGLIYFYFLWNLLTVLGYQINLYKCALCQKKLAPQKLYFKPKEGGIVCSNCFKKNGKGIEISPNIIKILRIFIEKKWEILKKLKINSSFEKSLGDISQNYLLYIRG